MHRFTPFSAVAFTVVVLFLGEKLPPGPENLRGFYEPLIGERLKINDMYFQTAMSALAMFRDDLNRKNVPLPLFLDRSLPENRPSSPTEVCVGVLTSRRISSPYAYIKQAISSLLVRMNLPDPDVYIHVFNVDSFPQSHSEISEIRDLVPVSNLKARKPEALLKVEIPQKFQESLDYGETFRTMKRMMCRNILIVEDDAIASDDWVNRIREALTQLDAQPDWFLVRLYAVRKTVRIPKGLKGITDFDQGYGTVAVMINSNHVDDFADSMERAVVASITGETYFEAKDLFISDYKWSTGLPVQALEPSIFQHTGMYSSLVVRNLDPDAKINRGMYARNFVSENVPITFNESRLEVKWERD